MTKLDTAALRRLLALKQGDLPGLIEQGFHQCLDELDRLYQMTEQTCVVCGRRNYGQDAGKICRDPACPRLLPPPPETTS